MGFLNVKKNLLYCGSHFLRRFYSSENAEVLEYQSKLRDWCRSEEENNIVVPVFKKALLYGNNTAIQDYTGNYSYFQLYSNSKRLSRQIANLCGSGSSSIVAFFYSNDVLCTLTIWACWMCGQIGMPLKSKTSFSTILQQLQFSHARLLIASETYSTLARKLAIEIDIPLLIISHEFIKSQNQPFNYKREIFMNNNLLVLEGILTNDFYTTFDALLLNTTDQYGRLMTVVLSHKNLNMQIQSSANVFQFNSEDRVINILPSQHTNGSFHSTLFPLTMGSVLHIHEPFHAPNCWSTLLGINAPQKDRANILMSEPIVYINLIAEYDKIFLKNNRMVDFIKNYCLRNFRLMICSFDFLPDYVYNRWLEITGHRIVDTYYMPETGMIFCNSNLHSKKELTSKLPFSTSIPNIKLRLVDNINNIILEINEQNVFHIPQTEEQNTIVGNLLVSGPSIFRKYYNAFENDNDQEIFFNTGLVASYENNIIKILGHCKRGKPGNLITPVEDINSLNNQFCMHPNIEDSKVKKCGIIFAVKPNRQMSLGSLKYFYAIVLKEYYRAIFFHLNNK